MAVPTNPTTAVAGQPTRASAQFNALAAQVAFLLSPPLTILRQTVTQNITNATYTDVLFDTEDLDRENGHSTVSNTGRYVSATAGYYLCLTTDAFAATATGGDRAMRFGVNGTTFYRVSEYSAVSSASLGSNEFGGAVIYLAVGDYVTVQARQDSGATLGTAAAENTPRFSVLFVSQ